MSVKSIKKFWRVDRYFLKYNFSLIFIMVLFVAAFYLVMLFSF